jgi:Protein of unknown function (DUF2380)
MAQWNAASLAAVTIAALTGGAAPNAGGNPRVAFFGFEFINTSLEPTKPVEEARLQMLDVFLRDKLSASGRFSFVSIPLELQKEIAAGPGIRTATRVSATSRTGLVRSGRRGELFRKSAISFSTSIFTWRMFRPENLNLQRVWIFAETRTSPGTMVSTTSFATT